MSRLIGHQNTEYSTVLHTLSRRASAKSGSRSRNFAMENYAGTPQEFSDISLENHLLLMCRGYPSRWNSCRTEYTKQVNAITFVPAGITPVVRAHTPFEVVACALDQTLVSGIENELDYRPTEGLSVQLNFQDRTLPQLINLLRADTGEDGQAEQLYIDHLTHALALRVLYLRKSMKPEGNAASPLPHRALRRVVERMHELDCDLNLETLAKISGYSRNHFLRMFQAATGHTPHNYLINLRLQRAKELIKNRSSSLVDIALSCGFSSHAHMCRVFRKFLGRSPSEWRRC